ncbi:hypothetical protein CHELA1G11_10358 [Hyphomicrobiales bacterium]|nr:hypothetical protein CHELA1G11_10358 [Hyphomicrobiales bacterium]CAH1675248.1 hypothetical protein CHELA1G2_13948 [Hyphomicrobiales bacterium]
MAPFGDDVPGLRPLRRDMAGDAARHAQRVLAPRDAMRASESDLEGRLGFYPFSCGQDMSPTEGGRCTNSIMD